MALDHFPLAHIKNLNAHPAFVHRISEYVAVLGVGRGDLLLFHQGVDILNLVPQFLGPFKIQFLRGLMHFPLQVFADFLMTAA
ncbi:hypothetical protein D1872_245190 [compost metagenome]